MIVGLGTMQRRVLVMIGVAVVSMVFLAPAEQEIRGLQTSLLAGRQYAGIENSHPRATSLVGFAEKNFDNMRRRRQMYLIPGMMYLMAVQGTSAADNIDRRRTSSGYITTVSQQMVEKPIMEKDSVIRRILDSEKILVLVGALIEKKELGEAGATVKKLKEDMEKDMDALADLADAKMVQVEKEYVQKAGASLFQALEDLELKIGEGDVVGAAFARIRAVAAYKKAIVGLV